MSFQDRIEMSVNDCPRFEELSSSQEPITIASSQNLKTSLEVIPELEEMITNSFLVRSHTLPKNRGTLMWIPSPTGSVQPDSEDSMEHMSPHYIQTAASLPSLPTFSHKPRIKYSVPAPLYRAQASK